MNFTKLTLFVIAMVAGSILTFSTTADACRGTTGFSAAFVQLEKSNLPAAQKAAIRSALEKGRAKHEQAHKNSSKGMMRESLNILDEQDGKM